MAGFVDIEYLKDVVGKRGWIAKGKELLVYPLKLFF